jgi:hypothetical protein
MKMRLHIRSKNLVWAAMLAAVCATSAARATTIERMSLEKMSQTSKIIVRAQCIGNSTTQDAGEIWTFTNFEVEDVWRGSAPSQITVRLLGGRAGNLTSSVSGVPRFRAGEEVLLFLEPTLRGDFSVVSWKQGTFRIRRDRATGRESATQDTASFATFDPATRRFQAAGIRQAPLDALHARVDAALRRGSSGAKQ